MPQATFVHEGMSIDYTPGADVAAGDVVVQGELIGVAKTSLVANRPGALAVGGVFDFAKSTASVISMGTLMYWNNTTKIATGTASGNALIGKCVRAAASGEDRVRILLSQRVAAGGMLPPVEG